MRGDPQVEGAQAGHDTVERSACAGTGRQVTPNRVAMHTKFPVDRTSWSTPHPRELLQVLASSAAPLAPSTINRIGGIHEARDGIVAEDADGPGL